jgi:hypothetical protein
MLTRSSKSKCGGISLAELLTENFDKQWLTHECKSSSDAGPSVDPSGEKLHIDQFGWILEFWENLDRHSLPGNIDFQLMPRNDIIKEKIA